MKLLHPNTFTSFYTFVWMWDRRWRILKMCVQRWSILLVLYCMCWLTVPPICPAKVESLMYLSSHCVSHCAPNVGQGLDPLRSTILGVFPNDFLTSYFFCMPDTFPENSLELCFRACQTFPLLLFFHSYSRKWNHCSPLQSDVCFTQCSRVVLFPRVIRGTACYPKASVFAVNRGIVARVRTAPLCSKWQKAWLSCYPWTWGSCPQPSPVNRNVLTQTSTVTPKIPECIAIAILGTLFCFDACQLSGPVSSNRERFVFVPESGFGPVYGVEEALPVVRWSPAHLWSMRSGSGDPAWKQTLPLVTHRTALPPRPALEFLVQLSLAHQFWLHKPFSSDVVFTFLTMRLKRSNHPTWRCSKGVLWSLLWAALRGESATRPAQPGPAQPRPGQARLAL